MTQWLMLQRVTFADVQHCEKSERTTDLCNERRDDGSNSPHRTAHSITNGTDCSRINLFMTQSWDRGVPRVERTYWSSAQNTSRIPVPSLGVGSPTSRVLPPRKNWVSLSLKCVPFPLESFNFCSYRWSLIHVHYHWRLSRCTQNLPAAQYQLALSSNCASLAINETGSTWNWEEIRRGSVFYR